MRAIEDSPRVSAMVVMSRWALSVLDIVVVVGGAGRSEFRVLLQLNRHDRVRVGVPLSHFQDENHKLNTL
jgi:hypothetical protein